MLASYLCSNNSMCEDNKYVIINCLFVKTSNLCRIFSNLLQGQLQKFLYGVPSFHPVQLWLPDCHSGSNNWGSIYRSTKYDLIYC